MTYASLRRMIGLLLLVCLCWPSTSPRAQADVPYIYYFSHDLRAFVIERADGIDTRVLGPALPEPKEEAVGFAGFGIDGPGWSPSGKWFAWTTKLVYLGGGPLPSRPSVVRADGAQRLTLLDHLDFAQMAWAPHDDRLLVVGQYRKTSLVKPGQWPPNYLYIGVIDVPQNKVVAEVETPFPLETWNPWPAVGLPPMWTPDGYAIAEFVAPPASDPILAVVITISPEGKITWQVYPKAATYNIEYYQQEQLASFYPRQNPVSPTGNVLYKPSKNLILENVVTGARRKLPLEYDLWTPAARWSPDANYALIYDKDLTLLEVETGRITPLLSVLKRDCPEIGRLRYAAWLPSSHSILLFADVGDVVQAYAIDVLEGRAHKLTPPGVKVYFDPPERPAGISLKGNAVLIPEFTEYQGSVWFARYDLSSGERRLFTRVRPLPLVGYDETLSPDQKYLTWIFDATTIRDLQTGEDHIVRPPYGSYNTAWGGMIDWHSNSQWLFIYDNAYIAGAGGGYDLAVARADGSFVHDLTYATLPTRNTANWLPPQVDLDRLPPPIKKQPQPQPARVFLGEGWPFLLSFSPDGKWLASVGDYSPAKIWDLAAGTATPWAEFNIPADQARIRWTLDGQRYQPEAVLVQGEAVFHRGTAPDGKSEVRNGGLYSIPGGKILFDASRVGIISASYSPDGKLLAIGSLYARGLILDTQTWRVLAALPHPTMGIAFSPDGKWLAANASWEIQLWRVEDLLNAPGKPDVSGWAY